MVWMLGYNSFSKMNCCNQVFYEGILLKGLSEVDLLLFLCANSSRDNFLPAGIVKAIQVFFSWKDLPSYALGNTPLSMNRVFKTIGVLLLKMLDYFYIFSRKNRTGS